MAMQSVPFIPQQSLRFCVRFTRVTINPVHLLFRPTPPPGAVSVRPTSRAFSVCLQCQFRRQPESYAEYNEKGPLRSYSEAGGELKAAKKAESADAIQLPGPDAGSQSAAKSPVAEVDQSIAESAREATGQNLLEHLKSESEKDESANANGTQPGGLPSYLEGRRSKWSKQFSTMMDNIQSNVFVAGQRLNDLTGYSAIEALKNEIQAQGKHVQSWDERRKT